MRVPLDSPRKKDALRLLIVIVILVVTGIRFERTLITVALAVVLLMLFVIAGRSGDNPDYPDRTG